MAEMVTIGRADLRRLVHECASQPCRITSLCVPALPAVEAMPLRPGDGAVANSRQRPPWSPAAVRVAKSLLLLLPEARAAVY